MMQIHKMASWLLKENSYELFIDKFYYKNAQWDNIIRNLDKLDNYTELLFFEFIGKKYKKQ